MSEPTRGLLPGLTVAITGATGNVGTALLRALASAGVAEVRGLARRQPPDTAPYAGVRWFSTDLGEPESEPVLGEFLTGADVVVHLAWALQPGREPERLRRVNVDGTQRVLDAAAAAGVPHVLHMSSIGVYSAGPHDRRISEDWPTAGIPSSQYSRDKVEAEHRVRDFLTAHPEVTVSVTRPTLVLQPDAGSEIGRYFLGELLLAGARLLPGAVAKLLPLPLPGNLSVAFVHADDVAGAIVRILDRRAPGPFNLSAEPALSADALAKALGTFRVPTPGFVLRAALQIAYRAHLVPTEPGWLDLGLGVPLLESARARTALDWAPVHRGDDVLREFVAALGRGQGSDSPLLQPAGGPRRSPA
ncbi:MAG TPA: NAD-dependent epimerase/dehydratase family protein [Modestobacter sp.]|jgi:nucleoside-diphosphate-sugar epimerase|nr:NAD-dependent epimerase/dehydratase family protein [Modestobacter sp.]